MCLLAFIPTWAWLTAYGRLLALASGEPGSFYRFRVFHCVQCLDIFSAVHGFRLLQPNHLDGVDPLPSHVLTCLEYSVRFLAKVNTGGDFMVIKWLALYFTSEY